MPDRAVDREEKIDETGEEKEDGYVEQCRYGLYSLRKTECMHAFENVLTRTGALAQRGLGLGLLLCSLLH